MSCAIMYAGAAFAPKITVIGVVGFLPALISNIYELYIMRLIADVYIREVS